MNTPYWKIGYNVAGTVYLAVNGELELTREGAVPPLLFDTQAEAEGYTTLTQDGGQVFPYG